MQNFEPFNYGNVLAQGEGIKGARIQNQLAQQQLDPNSVQNQLAKAQLQGAQQRNAFAQQQFSSQQQAENTKWLYNATSRVLQEPDLLPILAKEAQDRGIVDQNADPSSFTLDQVKQLNDELRIGMEQQEPGSTAAIKEYNLAKAQGYKGTFREYKKEMKSAGASTIDISTGESFSDRLGKKSADRLDELYEDANLAANEINAANEAMTLLDKGIISGTGGNLRLEFGRMLKTLGFGSGDEVARTDAYLASTAGLVASVIKQFGAGTGLSDADREYAAKMSAGIIELTPESMKKILGIRKRASDIRIERYNNFLTRATNKYPDLKGLYNKVDIPSQNGVNRGDGDQGDGTINFLGFE